MPHLYEDPLRFQPDRFHGTHNGAADRLLTFGGGIHACPGEQLAKLLTLAVAAAVFGEYRLILKRGMPRQIRYLPVKAPIRPIVAVLRTARG